MSGGASRQPAVESTTRRLKDRATRALGARKYEEAAEYYLALSHAEPEEPVHRLKLGEIYLRLRAKTLALELFRSAMNLFDRQFAYRKAAAVAAMVIEINPEDVEARRYLNQKSEPARRPTPISVPRPAPSALIPPVMRPAPAPVKEVYDLSSYEETELEAQISVRPPEPVKVATADSGWGWDGGIDVSWEDGSSHEVKMASQTGEDFTPAPGWATDGVGTVRSSRRQVLSSRLDALDDDGWTVSTDGM